MTEFRFLQLLHGSAQFSSEEEKQDYLRVVEGKRRSDAAKRAVATKRQKIATGAYGHDRWPSRATSKIKGQAGKTCQ